MCGSVSVCVCVCVCESLRMCFVGVCQCVYVNVCVSGYNACFQLPGANLYNNADLFFYI